MVELIVSANDSGQRLNKYIMKYLHKSTSSFVYKMLRKKNIVLNDKKAAGNELLKENDSVKLYLSDETIANFRSGINSLNTSTSNNKSNSEKVNSNEKLNSNEVLLNNKKYQHLKTNIKLLYKDDCFLAFNKPAGLLSQKSKAADYSINEYLIDYCMDNGLIDTKSLETFTPSVCNRIDRNTSGIILAGITLKGSQAVSYGLREKKFDKYYMTLVSGCLKSKVTLRAYIIKDEKNNKSQVIDSKEYDKLSKTEQSLYNAIETIFKPVASNKSYTLVQVKLLTGKSHQIRASLKYLGYPIVGDGKYGNPTVNKYMKEKYKLSHHLLHAAKLIIPKESLGYNKDEIIIEAPLPIQFVDILKGEDIPWERGIQEA